MEKTRESVAEEIAEAVKTWEKYDWKHSDLWESFQDDFEGYCGRVKSTCLRAGRWAGGR